jgi:predicted dehydrogenase
MAKAYFKILKALDVDTTVIGRGKASAAAFEEAMGQPVVTGGIESADDSFWDANFTHAIVAVPVENLAGSTAFLIDKAVPEILTEKPAGVTPEEVSGLLDHARKSSSGSNIYVAYNRRFYPSTRKAKELIKEHGGATSFAFEFSEYSVKIEPAPKKDIVKKNWFYANSTHVVDMAFFIAGAPKSVITQNSGSLSWTDTAIFMGMGQSTDDVPFSYSANWGGAPRWSVSITTDEGTLELQPLEKVFFRSKENFSRVEIEIPAEAVEDGKVGVTNMLLSFFAEEHDPDLITLEEHDAFMSGPYKAINEGSNFQA